MSSQHRKAFANIREFREYTRVARVVYYLIFRGMPDPDMIDALAGCGADEAVVLLDLDEDRGFLTSTDVTIDITPDREFVTRKMADCPGLGSWSKGTPLSFVTCPADVPGLMAHARRFAFPTVDANVLARVDQ